METIIKKINIYKFEELSEEVQKKLIEEEKESQIEIYIECCLLEDMQEKSKELLQKYFKNNAIFKNVYYDLSYCQGSGAMIEFNLKYYNNNLKIKQCGHYFHEWSFDIDGWWTNCNLKRVQNLKEKIAKMNKELANFGYKAIECAHLTDEESKNILNEYKFLENGTIYNN